MRIITFICIKKGVLDEKTPADTEGTDSDEEYVVTEPVKDFTNLNPDLENWLVNQNPNLFTDAVISKMFKLSPVEE